MNNIPIEEDVLDPKFTYEEFMLALCVWREGRGEPFEGKQFIAQTIRNRAKDKKRWPNDIVRVILQPKQFSSFNYDDPQTQKFPFPADKTWDECYRAITEMPEIAETGVNHYHVIGLKKKWDINPKWTKTIGNHIFFKL